MSGNWRQNTKNNNEKNNRIHIVIAIVFLLCVLTIYKMFDLQILNNDYYTALAASQHEILGELKPERGVIYVNDLTQTGNMIDGDNTMFKVGLYPYAYNKDFANIFAIPKDLDDTSKLADQVWEFFDREKIEAEISERIHKEEKSKLDEEVAFIRSLDPGIQDEKLADAMTRFRGLAGDGVHQQELQAQIDAELQIRKEQKISEYLEKFNKSDDPYEPIAEKVDSEKLLAFFAAVSGMYEADDLELKHKEITVVGMGDKLKIKGISYRMEPYRYYPEKDIGSQVLGFVSYADVEPHGNYGLEGFFDKELFGEYGSIKSARGARRDIVIVNDREFNKAINGKDLVLTIDRSIQYFACNELNAAALRHGADSGTVIIVDPKTGGILAMCSWPDFDPNEYRDVKNIDVFNNPAVFDQYEPGSVMKPITMAAAIDQDKVNPNTSYNDTGQIMIKGWPKPISNSDFDTFGAHGWSDMNTVLELSLNTGAIFAMRQLGAEKFSEYLQNFGFGEKTGIELGQESGGNISNLLANNIKEIDAAVASFGQGLTVTPLQMVMSYAALANKGVLMKPYLVREIINDDKTSTYIQPRIVRKVVSEKAAGTVLAMLVRVVEHGHAKRAAVKGYYIGGKTGTAQVASDNSRGYSGKYIHTFVGFGPADDPKYVILVKLDDPKDARYAESTAVPVAGKIGEFILQHYQVPKER